VITQPGLFARAAAFGLLLGSTSVADAKTRAECEQEYTPQRAQEGKDVIWAPTEDAMVVGMLEMAKVTAADKVYDLGAGDGKIVIAAAKQTGATGVGIEYDADLVRHARCLAEAEGVDGLVTFIQGDIFETDFSDATVIALYLLPELNLRLLPTFLAMKPGTRIVSYSFGIGDWKPDNRIDSYGQGSAFLWIVPAHVAGAWTFRPVSGGAPFDVELEQMFQDLSGTADGMSVAGKLSGDRIDFGFIHDSEQVRVSGTVSADRIAATVTRSRTQMDYVGARN
jgi:methyltransferase family protein